MAPQDNHFQLSRKARAGALLLLGILLILILVWRLLPALLAPRQDPEEKRLQAAWEQFEKEHMQEAPASASGRDGGYEYHEEPENEKVAIHMASFDPNTAGEEQLMALGLPQRTARTLIKYRSKGGRFRRREDLQKLYTLSAEDYKRIAPYVSIPGAEPGKDMPAAATVVPERPAFVELNEADAGALIALPGIGPGYSRRILAFRDALGGFLEVAQLQEVYGFPDSTYQLLKDRFRVDPSRLKKINVNTATEEELARHPYIGRKLAPGIIKLRNDLKNYTDISQLRQTPLINEEKYRKIAPYLSTH